MNPLVSFGKAVNNSFKSITDSLRCEIVGIERITKIYGSNANIFILKTIHKNHELKIYVLKFSRSAHIDNEVVGDLLVSKVLPTPNLILISNKKLIGLEWALYEYIEGDLMTEKFLLSESLSKDKKFLTLERRKEKLLTKMHSVKKQITFKEYLESKTNLLFYSRINGKRYKDFYSTQPDDIATYFDKKIVVNNLTFPKTINEEFEKIKQKYRGYKDSDLVTAILGHGDAHHGNILIDKKIFFIDNEYAAYIPPFMELAKPYYNDFLGTLFFHYSSMLTKYFSITSIKNNINSLTVNVDIQKRMDLRIAVTEIKLLLRKSTINEKTIDFLSLNDYLVLCHTLTKNPNLYDDGTQVLFWLN